MLRPFLGGRKLRLIILFCCCSLSLLFGLILLVPLPTVKPYSLVVRDRNGEFLHAFLAPDGVWRVRTSPNEIPPQLKQLLLDKEDRFFYYHPGVNPFSVLRALAQNVLSGCRVSGASTLTMQVARMLEPKERTYTSKLFEMFRAFQLEWKYSKDEILELYLSMVPLGGNIEGLQTASLLYYQTPLERLNVGQLIDLILVPNDPNAFRPDRQPDRLLQKRKQRALTWVHAGLLTPKDSIIIWETSASAERKELPRVAPHFALRVKERSSEGGSVTTTLDKPTQLVAEALLRNHLRSWKARGIQNGAVFILDNSTRHILAYVGSEDFNNSTSYGQVDAVRAVRSPGSTLKPFLYAYHMDRGTLTPKSRLLDVPYDAEGYVAENFDGAFSGLVFADEALRRSLNVPMVRLLKEAGVKAFVSSLVNYGVASLEWQRERVGLSLILGGCGVTLEELTAAYASFPNGGMYAKPVFTLSEEASGHSVFSTSASYMVTEILSGIERPDVPNNFESSMNLPKVAFKTGTSYGKRDAWCLGYSSEYTIGVWIGNVTNRGVPELLGSKSATPLLIDLFNSLPHNNRKTILRVPPDIGLRWVCASSGKLPTDACSSRLADMYSATHSLNEFCDVDKEYLLSADGKSTYCTSCVGRNNYRTVIFQEYAPDLLNFYRRTRSPVSLAPKHNSHCERLFAGHGPSILSPSENMTYLVSSKDQTIPVIAASGVDAREHLWYVNKRFYKRTKVGEKLFLALGSGSHTISCIDDKGRMSSVHFLVRHM